MDGAMFVWNRSVQYICNAERLISFASTTEHLIHRITSDLLTYNIPIQTPQV